MLMTEVTVKGLDYTLLLETDERLDLAPLLLLPPTIRIQGRGGLVGANGWTKRSWPELLEKLQNPAAPLEVTGITNSGRKRFLAG